MTIGGEPKPEGKNKMVDVFTLPNKDEMLTRLQTIADNSHIQQGLYPLLLTQAGRKKMPIGVVMMLTLAIRDYTQAQKLPPMMAKLLLEQVPEFIDALIPDQKMAEEAKKHWEKING